MLSRSLKDETEAFARRILRSRLFEQLEVGAIGPETAAVYLTNLAALLKATPEHLRLARRSANELGRAALIAYFDRKLAEEEGHDAWARNDLLQVQRLYAVEPPRRLAAPVARLIRELEDEIRICPAAYVGYAVFAEYFTVLVGPACLRALERCGFPLSAFTALARHVELDQAHASAGFRDVDRLLISESEERSLLRVVRSTMENLAAFYDELATHSLRAAPRSAPAALSH